MGNAFQEQGAHGIMMITAWMLCASISLMVARFFRAMPGPRCRGTAIWFNIHRVLMVLTLLLTVAAFILIFIEAGGWVKDPAHYQSAHPYIGTVVTLLVILNPILSLARPPPDGKRRVFFNWVHWGVGMSAWILAMVNIAFGTFMLGLGYSDPEIWIFLAFIVEHGLTDLMFTKFDIEDKKRLERALGSGDGQASGSLSISEKPQVPANRGVNIFRYAFMVFYLISVLGLWVALVVLIAKKTIP